MYRRRVEEKLERIMRKLVKKNRILALQVYAKMDEILSNPYHYKPLRAPLQNLRRAHVGSFVLIYRIDAEENVVVFLAFAHHDEAYE